MAYSNTWNAANGFVGFGVESTAGTPVTPTAFAPTDGFSFSQNITYAARPTLLSVSGFNPTVQIKVASSGAGTFSGPATYDNFGLFWQGVLGAGSSSGAGPYTHTYTTDGAALPSHTIEYSPTGDQAEEVTIAGAKFNSMTLTIPKDGIAKIEADFIAMSATDYASGTARTAPTNERLIVGAQSTITIGGTDHSDAIDNLKLTINNALRARTSIGSFTPREIEHAHGRTGTLTITLQVEDTYYKTLVDDWLASTKRAIIITCTNASESLTATLAVCYQTAEPAISITGPGPITVTLTYDVKPDSTATQMASVVVINDESSDVGNG